MRLLPASELSLPVFAGRNRIPPLAFMPSGVGLWYLVTLLTNARTG